MTDFPEGWHPVALSRDIEPGTSTGVLVGGREVVVWRDTDGVAHAWEDRCPHRGMRLSFGFVRGNHIACLYHGWQFDTEGRCRHIPAHPALEPPASITVWHYRCAEVGGFVWVAAKDEDSVPPRIEGDSVPVRSLTIAAPLEAVLPALYRQATVRKATIRLMEVSASRTILVVAMQTIADDRTALHIQMRPGGDLPGALRWAQRLRTGIEEPDGVFYVAPPSARETA